MIEITSITLHEILMPLKEPFQTATGIRDNRRILLLRVTDSDGVHVWSECVAGEMPDYTSETVDTAWQVLQERIAPLVLGKPFQNQQQLHQTLEQTARDYPMASASVEMAVWALLAEKQQVSLSEMLGGTRSRVATGISLGIQKTPEDLIEKVRRAFDEGYQRVKLKIKPDADLAYLQAVRESLGDDVQLMADANCAYGREDFEHLKRLDDFNLTMLEQPLPRDDLSQLAELQRLIKTPICLDESITGPERNADMIRLKSARIVNIKPGRVGGFTPAIAIHDLCAGHKIPVWCGGMLESGIGRAYNVALASLPNFTLPGDLSPSARYWEEDIVSPEWTMDAAAMVKVPRDRVGIGVKVDENRIENLTTRVEVVRKIGR